MLAVLTLLLAMPVPTAAPAEQPEYFVDVDYVVINRVRTYQVTLDDWGRPTWTANETVWLSFWDRLPVAVLPAPGVIMARGWWTSSNLLEISPCTEGWVFRSKDGINVIASELRFVNSPFDWEMRHRRIFRPIRRP